MTPETHARILALIAASDANTDLRDIVECSVCGFRWDDTIVTELTPAPSGRCPNEYNHCNPQGESE